MKPELRDQVQAALADRYTLDRDLGRGGMASVVLATDLQHDRPVALKVLHPELHPDGRRRPVQARDPRGGRSSSTPTS